jgi:hypothetical protein
MPGNDHEVVVVPEDPFSDLFSGLCSVVFPVENRCLFPERSFRADDVDCRIGDLKKAGVYFCSVGCYGRILAGDLISTTSEFKAHCSPDVARNLRLWESFRVLEFNRVRLGCGRIDLKGPPMVANY